jgi:hypothetical protein
MATGFGVELIGQLAFDLDVDVDLSLVKVLGIGDAVVGDPQRRCHAACPYRVIGLSALDQSPRPDLTGIGQCIA